jgi:hypothetical protein
LVLWGLMEQLLLLLLLLPALMAVPALIMLLLLLGYGLMVVAIMMEAEACP